MPITVKDIPASIKADKNVTPFIARSVELTNANPVVSYYCKVYVLEHILSQKLHQTDPETEHFTISLLDETEATKSSHADESVQQVLSDKQLSINLVFVFAFKLFHACLEDLKEYDGDKTALMAKLRATINFWALFSVFTGDGDEPIDYAKTTGGTCTTQEQFVQLVKEKTKTLKYQLSRLLKDEVPIKGEEKELEQMDTSDPAMDGSFKTDTQEGDFEDSGSDSKHHDFASKPQDSQDDLVENGSPADKFTDHVTGDSESTSAFNLPGAPNFNPDQDGSEINLPGAPKYIPDEETSAVNKNSSIKVILPGVPAPEERGTVKRAESSKSVQVTKADVSEIVDTTEQITKVQKHAKFAISALNYEDLPTAEAELRKGLELLSLLKAKAN